MTSDFKNEYGDEELALEIRRMLVKQCNLLELLKGIKQFLVSEECGVVIKKMCSEVILHLAKGKEFISLLVSNVISTSYSRDSSAF